MEQLCIPEKIQSIVGTKAYLVDNVGMSDSQVRIYDEFVLKFNRKAQKQTTRLKLRGGSAIESRFPR